MLVRLLLIKCVFRAALQDLFLRLFEQQVMEDVYPAAMAQYMYSLTSGDQGLLLKINGFNQKLPVSCPSFLPLRSLVLPTSQSQ